VWCLPCSPINYCFPLTIIGFAQIPDTLRTTKLDLVSTRFNAKVNSIQLRAKSKLKPDLGAITSKLQRKKNAVPDSLQAAHQLDSIKTVLTSNA
jgi:hypothetical protein